MLIPAEDLKDSFVCPVSGQRLERMGDGSFVTMDRCYRYPIVSGLPVLVDFERSVLRQEDVISSDLASAVHRRDYGPVGRLVKRLISPPKQVTRQNVGRLLHELRRSTTEKTVLIVGGGKIGQGMAPLYDAQDVRIAAFDIYASENIQFIADGHQIPFSDAVFDAVVVQAVLEHVLVPQAVVDEIYRVLRTDGLVYAETPFLQQVHEGPYDFSRFTESGHRYLFRNFDPTLTPPRTDSLERRALTRGISGC